MTINLLRIVVTFHLERGSKKKSNVSELFTVCENKIYYYVGTVRHYVKYL